MLPEVGVRRESPFDGPAGGLAVFGDLGVKGESQARLGHSGAPCDQGLELLPTGSLALALPLEQPETLTGEEQPGMIGIDPVLERVGFRRGITLGKEV